MLEQRATISTRKKRYVKPRILTLEVLSSAIATKLENTLALENPPWNPDLQPGTDRPRLPESVKRAEAPRSFMTCIYCRDCIPDDSWFCPKCGVRLRVDVAARRPWLWICTIMFFALVWSVVLRKELQDEIINLRAQINNVLNAL
jgi:hypothetical protein